MERASPTTGALAPVDFSLYLPILVGANEWRRARTVPLILPSATRRRRDRPEPAGFPRSFNCHNYGIDIWTPAV